MLGPAHEGPDWERCRDSAVFQGFGNALARLGAPNPPPDAEKGPVGGIPAPSQDSSVAGGGIPLLRSEYMVHDFTASVKQFLPIADIVD